MWHFIRVYAVCWDKNDFLRKKNTIDSEIETGEPFNYTIDHSKFIASIQKEEFTYALRVLLIFNIKVLNYTYMMKHQIL